MERHPWRRLLAWLIDWCCVLLWAGALAAVAVPLYRAGLITTLSPLAGNIVGAAVLVVPATFALAALESGRRGATIGKRVAGLRVETGGGSAPSLGRSLARNTLKIMVPWLIGHAAVYALSDTSGAAVPGWLWALTVAAYVLPIVWVVSLFVGSGRTPYDRIVGTYVAPKTGATVATRRTDAGVTDPSASGGAG